MANPTRKCKECGREMMIIGKGMCGKCYYAARKKEPVAFERRKCATQGCTEEPEVGQTICCLCREENNALTDIPYSEPAPETAAAVDSAIEVIRPSNLTRFLTRPGLIVEIPEALTAMMFAEGIGAADIVELVGLLLKGQLRRVA